MAAKCEWIQFSKSIPKYDQPVLVSLAPNDEFKEEVIIALMEDSYEEFEFLSSGFGDIYTSKEDFDKYSKTYGGEFYATAWMPLPEPYKAGD